MAMVNTVGSLEIPKLLRARKNLELVMTDRQRDILIGCILGDAYVSPQGKLRIEQSVKQKEYIDWKFNELRSLAYPALPREINHLNKLNGKTYASIFFVLRQYFRIWRSIFYEGRNKIFPENLLISPLTLAIWYMDDGCWTGKKCVIAIEGFDDQSIFNIQRAFQSQLGIETIVGKNRKLIIRKQSHAAFYALISQFIVPSMQYKIPNPVTTCPETDGAELLNSAKTPAPSDTGMKV